MKKMSLIALMAAVLLAGSALKAADRAGIGLSWGVGVQTFNDSRLAGVSQILDINFKVDKGLTLYVHTEQQDISYDNSGSSADKSTIRYNGFGLKYIPNSYVNVGICFGQADLNIDDGSLEETTPFASIVLGVDLLNAQGEKIDYNLGVTISYRMVETEDDTITGGGDEVQNFNGTQVALNLGITF